MTNKIPWIGNIKVIIWDLDGTLYHELPEINHGVRQLVIKVVAEAQKVSRKEAEQLFDKTYERLGSGTKSLIELGVNKQEALSGNWFAPIQLKYIKRDKKLPKLFFKLRKFRHIIDTNASMIHTKQKLIKLGLPLKTFEKIFTNTDMFGVMKPDLLPFEAILKYTKLPPHQHLFIGDREKTDLVPAKKVGMRTCLVWGKSRIADVVVSSVYDVEKLLL